MSWHFIVQPDGLLATFTDEDQDFIDFALTKTEALQMCERAGIGPERARRMVREALDEIDQDTHKPGDRFSRWNEALRDIKLSHGSTGLEFALSEMGFAGYTIPARKPRNDGQPSALAS